MKKNIVFAAALALFVFAFTATAQKTPNFSGTWTLDVSKSKLGERNMIESQTLTVVQTDKDVKVTPATKFMAPPAGGGRPGGGMGGGEASNTYMLDGKETTVERDTPRGKVPVKLKGKLDGGKLTLSSSRTMSLPNGEMTLTTKETWSLSADGNTLTIDAEMANPRGTNSSQRVFTKKP